MKVARVRNTYKARKPGVALVGEFGYVTKENAFCFIPAIPNFSIAIDWPDLIQNKLLL